MDQRRILFITRDGSTIFDLPLEIYESGDIKKTKTRLVEELACEPEAIEVRIAGIKDEDTTPTLRLIHGGRR